MLILGIYPSSHTKVNVSPDLTGPTGFTSFKWEIPSGNMQDPEKIFTMILRSATQIRTCYYLRHFQHCLYRSRK